jgi:hypothetical protein
MRNLFTRLSAAGVGLVDYLKGMVIALRIIIAAFIVGLGIGGFLLGPAALALVFPGQFAPRQFPSQQIHYERHVINITSTNFTADQAQNSCVFAAGTCSARIAALPYNSFIVRASSQLLTVCNAATTCTWSLGTASATPANIVAATSILTGVTTQIQSPAIVATGGGILLTGNGIAQTGANGGFDLFLNVTFTGAAPTTGTLVVVLEYYAPNDGGCSYVPMGSTAVAC